MKSIDSSKLRALILDMDGVLWKDSQPIGDLPAIFSRIERCQWQVMLATNNATRAVEQHLEKLRNFGVTLRYDQIVNSGQAAAHYLSRQHPGGGNVYVVGEEGLVKALSEKGFTVGEQNALAVVAAMDRGLTYDKLTRATRLIRSGVPFIGTNPDRTFPTPEGLAPGAGAVLAAIEAATDTQPIIVGKPAPEMYRVALNRMGTTPEETLVVGDRLETDIAGGQKIGCRTALVLSGVTALQAAKKWEPAPDWIAEDLTELLDLIPG